MAAVQNRADHVRLERPGRSPLTIPMHSELDRGTLRSIIKAAGRAAAQRAGHLLAKLKLSSAHAVDAFVVATALQFDTAVIATGDPNDIRRLAAPFRRIAIFAL